MIRSLRLAMVALACCFCLSAFSGCEVEVDEGPVEDTMEELGDD